MTRTIIPWNNLCLKKYKYCNRFDQRVARQQLSKHGPTCNRSGCVFYVVRAEQRWYNGVMQPVSKERLKLSPRKEYFKVFYEMT
jgi:hypothetical protein